MVGGGDEEMTAIGRTVEADKEARVGFLVQNGVVLLGGGAD